METTETELNWIELNWIELNWTELNWIELNWTKLNWIEQNWIEKYDANALSWAEYYALSLRMVWIYQYDVHILSSSCKKDKTVIWEIC